MGATATATTHQRRSRGFRFSPTTDFGSASLLFFTSALTSFLYWRFGYAYIAHEIHPHFSAVLASLLIVTVIFSFGCAIHLKFIGGKSWRKFRREINEEVSEISQMIQYCHKTIQQYDRELQGDTYSMPPRGTESLIQARKLLSALEARVHDVTTLLNTRNDVDMMDAYDLLHQRLSTKENCFERLIDAPPIDGLKPEEWAPTFEEFFAEVEHGLLRRRMMRKG